MQLIGLLGPALTVSPVMNLLIQAYGIGTPTVEHKNPLSAPQATLMYNVVKAIFSVDIPYILLAIGAGIALLIIIIDIVLKK